MDLRYAVYLLPKFNNFITVACKNLYLVWFSRLVDSCLIFTCSVYDMTNSQKLFSDLLPVSHCVKTHLYSHFDIEWIPVNSFCALKWLFSKGGSDNRRLLDKVAVISSSFYLNNLRISFVLRFAILNHLFAFIHFFFLFFFFLK